MEFIDLSKENYIYDSEFFIGYNNYSEQQQVIDPSSDTKIS